MRSLLLILISLAGSRAFRLPHLRNPVSPRAATGQRGVPVVDVDRLKAFGLVAAASVVLVASPMPAHAKGGGHGGGGGGGHSSSHSSSSSYRSYTSGSYGSSSSSRRTLQTKSPISYTKDG